MTIMPMAMMLSRERLQDNVLKCTRLILTMRYGVIKVGNIILTLSHNCLSQTVRDNSHFSSNKCVGKSPLNSIS